MSREESYLNLLNTGKLEQLKNVLEEIIVSKDSYVSTIKSYYKNVARPEMRNKYYKINNMTYISDGYSLFKVDEEKVKKSCKLETGDIKTSIESIINSKRLKNSFELDLFNYDLIDNTYILVDSNLKIDVKYFVFARKFLKVKKVEVDRDSPSEYSPLYILEDGKVAGVILPLM